jgi:UPF0716 protein FxsA
MLSRLLVIYAVVELGAIIALVSTVGWGWTLLVLLATSLLGWGILAPMAGSRLMQRIGQLRSGLAEPRNAASDGAVVSLATVLVLAPGLVSTALGLLLLMPPVRSVAGPGLTAIVVRRLQRRAPRISYATAFQTDSYSTGPYATGHGDYIDGEVIDVREVSSAARPERSSGRWSAG